MGLKSRCIQHGALSGGFGGESVPGLLQILVAASGLGLWSHPSSLCFCFHITFSSACLIFLCLSHKDAYGGV